MDSGGIGAVILAAGYSSRMGASKPLLPFGGGAVIDRVIDNLRGAGVEKIVVVLGYRGNEIRVHLANRPVVLAENPAFDEGMFSSVLVGVRAVMELMPDAFFLTPVDCPMVTPGVLRALMRARAESGRPVAYPVYCGKKGHPPLISADCAPAILSHDGTMGLKGALEPFSRHSLYLEVEEAGAITDMDTPGEYKRDVAILDGTHQPRLLFVQGDFGVGKSSLLAALTASRRKAVGGFYNTPRLERGRCTGFVLHAVQEDTLPKKRRTPEGERTFLTRGAEGWRFVPEVFENWCAPLLLRELRQGLPLFLLDELGGVELQCPAFREALSRLLHSGAACVGAFKQQQNLQAQREVMDVGADCGAARAELVQTIVEEGGRILTLTPRNREQVRGRLDELVSRATAASRLPRDARKTGLDGAGFPA